MLVMAGSCAFTFPPTRGPTLEWFVESSVTNKEPTMTLLGKLKLLLVIYFSTEFPGERDREERAVPGHVNMDFLSSPDSEERRRGLLRADPLSLCMKKRLGGVQRHSCLTSWQLSQDSPRGRGLSMQYNSLPVKILSGPVGKPVLQIPPLKVVASVKYFLQIWELRLPRPSMN